MSEATKPKDPIVMLENVRLAFPVLWTPEKAKDGKGKPAFSASFLFPPEHPAHGLIKAAILQVARGKWGDTSNEILAQLVAGRKVCLHDGAEKPGYEGYAGNKFVSARGYVFPLVIDADRSLLTEASGKPYSGSYVNAQVSIWAQQNEHGKRVNAQLAGVQFLRDGQSFGGGRVATVDEFGDVSSEGADGEAPVAGAGVADPFGDLVGTA